MFSLILLILSITTIISGNSAQINPNRPTVFNDRVANVKSSRIEKRRLDERKVQFEFDGQIYKFNFVQSDRNVYDRYSPVWLVKSAPGNTPNYTYNIVENSHEFIHGHFYIDNDQKATVYVHFDSIKQKILYDGTFGEGNASHVINSLEHLGISRSRIMNEDHLIKKSNRNNNAANHLHSLASTHMEQKFENSLTVFYPKVLTVVDYHLFRKLGSNIAKTVQYVATYWNAVDRKYIELDSPKVQFVLTGIIVAEDETALNYVYQSRYIGRAEPDKANIQNMLDYTRTYFHNFSNEVNFENYDATVVLTGLDTKPAGGIAGYYGKICDDWLNTAIISDDGQFKGVLTTVHEMAHLMNVSHDSFEEGHRCYARSGDGSLTVMSPVHIKKEFNSVHWSQCSKEDLHNFSKSKEAECLEKRYRTRHYPKN